jgi:hypothetical protein
VVVHLVAARAASLELFIFLVAGLALVLCVLFGVRRSSIAGDAPEASGVSLRDTEIQAASVVSLQIAIYLDGFASNSTDSIVGLILLVVPHMLAFLITVVPIRLGIPTLAVLSRGSLKRIGCHRRSLGLVYVVHSVHKSGLWRIDTVQKVGG